MSRAAVKKIVKSYARELRRNKFPFQMIYLFGSYASGKPKKCSDIDVAVVTSDKLLEKSYMEKKMQLWRLTLNEDARIEPILLGSKELANEVSLMASEVAANGIRIE